MKLQNIISFAIGNSILLFIFGALLAGCQKKSFEKHGALTKHKLSIGRSIASTPAENNGLTDFTSFQDPKQILLYCHNTTKRVKTCYKSNINQVISDFQKKYKNMSNQKFEAIKVATSYEKVATSMGLIVKEIIEENKNKMDQIVETRSIFCSKNSKRDLGKCLKQYLEKDTFSLLNNLHGKIRMNGHEYLYFKNQLKENLDIHLSKASEKIQKQRKTIL